MQFVKACFNDWKRLSSLDKINDFEVNVFVLQTRDAADLVENAGQFDHVGVVVVNNGQFAEIEQNFFVQIQFLFSIIRPVFLETS